MACMVKQGTQTRVLNKQSRMEGSMSKVRALGETSIMTQDYQHRGNLEPLNLLLKLNGCQLAHGQLFHGSLCLDGG
jgi:hypothetical protein